MEEDLKRKYLNFSIFRISNERDEVVRDHQNVERAFADLNHKYERTKEVVAGMQLSEDNLKHSVDSLNRRYLSYNYNNHHQSYYPRHTAGEMKYQQKKTEAEAELAG